MRWWWGRPGSAAIGRCRWQRAYATPNRASRRSLFLSFFPSRSSFVFPLKHPTRHPLRAAAADAAALFFHPPQLFCPVFLPARSAFCLSAALRSLARRPGAARGLGFV